MKQTILGNSDLSITTLGFGAWAIGGLGYEYSWGPQDDNESIDGIHRALDLGINWIDTAAGYGLGHSEEVVARALAGWSGTRPYIFSKCGIRWDQQGKIFKVLEADSIRRECEDSLRRLQVDAIDLYQIHWPTDNLADIDAAWGALAKLKQQGKLRYIGVSNFNVAQMRHAQTIAPVTSLQPPYSLLRREIEAVVELPDRKANLFIKLCLQNHGHLLPAKRRSHFEELKDAEVAALESAVRKRLGAFRGHDDQDEGATPRDAARIHPRRRP